MLCSIRLRGQLEGFLAKIKVRAIPLLPTLLAALNIGPHNAIYSCTHVQGLTVPTEE